MLIAARNAMLAGGGSLSAKSYVQDGLIAMWDGIENAGFGTHDSSAATWKDLIGTLDLTPNRSAHWESNGLASSSHIGYLANRNATINTIGTIEVAFDMSGETANNAGRCLVKFSNSRALMGNGLFGLRSRGEPSIMMDSNINKLKSKFGGAVVYGTTAADDILYFNGEEQQTTSSGGNWNLNSMTYVGGDGGTSTSVIGVCHCIRVYSRALTAAEVAADYAVDKARFNLT